MASYGMNDVKNGMKILVNGEPCIITDTEYVKPGKGQAFTRVKYRNIKTGRVVELTMKATDYLEAADVIDTDMQFLYAMASTGTSCSRTPSSRSRPTRPRSARPGSGSRARRPAS
jgi:translation elongation factor P/translation initiation factor 5A